METFGFDHWFDTAGQWSHFLYIFLVGFGLCLSDRYICLELHYIINLMLCEPTTPAPTLSIICDIKKIAVYF